MITPEHILFPCPENDFQAPFKHKSELAKWLVKTKGSPFFSKPESSMKAHLSALFRPSSNSLHRPYTKKFHDALKYVLKKKLKSDQKTESLGENILEAFKTIKEAKRVDELSEQDEIKHLLDKSKQAKVRFIITAEPAEIQLSGSNTFANELNQLLLHFLKDENNFNKTQYLFYFPNEDVAHGFWNSLFDELKKTANLKQSKTTLQKANVNMLKVFIIDEVLCLTTYAVLEPEDKANRKGYYIHYKKQGDKIKPEVGELEPEMLANIYRLLYMPLSSTKKYNRKEISFNNFLNLKMI